MSDSPKESHCHCSCHDPALSGFSCVHCKRVAISTESPITRDELREMFQKNSAVSNAFSFSPAKFEECLDLILQELDKAVRQTNISQIENWRDWIKDDKDSAWLVKEMDDAIESLKDETLTDCNGVFLEFTTSNERGL